MAARRVVVAAHGHCFDGLASAVMFTHFRKRIDPRPVRFQYRSCGYGPQMRNIPGKWLTGDENAIVDFKFAAPEKLTWYFDHHVTAFASPEQQAQALKSSKRYFYDATYPSCTKLIADVVKERYSINFEDYASLVDWANKIDSASFDSAEQAIDRSEPVMQLASVVEQHGDGPLLNELVPRLLGESVEDVARSEDIRKRFAPIGKAQQATTKRIRSKLERRGNVAYADLHQAQLKASGKFVAYALAPECAYSVALIRMRKHYKISVGYNPWCNVPRSHDIASLCQRYGGGGHPVVGAVSLPLSKLDRAIALSETITAELNSG